MKKRVSEETWRWPEKHFDLETTFSLLTRQTIFMKCQRTTTTMYSMITLQETTKNADQFIKGKLDKEDASFAKFFWIEERRLCKTHCFPYFERSQGKHWIKQ